MLQEVKLQTTSERMKIIFDGRVLLVSAQSMISFISYTLKKGDPESRPA